MTNPQPPNQQSTALTFRSDIVWPWGLFFSELGEYLSGEVPSLTRVKIEFVLGDFLTPPAISGGEADVGFVTPPACVWMAYRGTGPFAREMHNLRAIAALPHDDRMMWAVPAESPIRSIRDMKAHPMRLVIPSGTSRSGSPWNASSKRADHLSQTCARAAGKSSRKATA